ncbi:MAG: hypothetical protein D6692_07590 [Planctomycetota bacterium]|nr:MAG: hypothetical protein D6692_07590 [Planctomycetota bacterium]
MNALAPLPHGAGTGINPTAVHETLAGIILLSIGLGVLFGVTITLPKNPHGEDYEDLVGAYLLALGYFIETNLHLREGTVEILELDIIATPTTNPLSEAVLLDAKSGKSGFADIFKMFGWMKYLDISKGCVVRTQSPDASKRDAMEVVKQATNVHVATLDLASDVVDLACLDGASIAMTDDVRTSILSAAWYGRIGQRKCLRAFIDFCKSEGDSVEAVKAAIDYRWAIEQAFLAPKPIRRASRLYSAYSASPQVTGGLIAHVAGGDATQEKAEWEKVRDLPERLGFQYSLMLENTARLGIVKNALLHLLDKESQPSTPKPKGPQEIDWSAFSEWTMPESFRTGLAALKAHPHRTKIPRLFQIFIEVFGGFYRLGADDDLAHLSVCTGIPKEDIVPCLEMFNSFFPIPGGWFISAKGEMAMMKMVPAVFRGTGAFVRGGLSRETNYSRLYPQMGWLVSKWHNALYHVLEPHLKSPSA